MREMLHNKFKIGQYVGVIYKNSCNETVKGFGIVENYSGRYYTVKTQYGMYIKAYCNKVFDALQVNPLSNLETYIESKNEPTSNKVLAEISSLNREIETLLKYFRFAIAGIAIIQLILICILCK